MKPKQPFISVILPVRNGMAHLSRAVETLREQTRPPDEVIVVDDGSTDGSAERAAALPPPFRLVRQGQQGPAAARNRGLAEARGEIIAFLDVDDAWPADKLAVQQMVLDDDPEIDAVLGLVRIIPARDERLPGKLLTPHFRVNLGAGLFRQRLFEAVGAFDPSMRLGEDFDWLVRVLESGGQVRWLQQVTLFYRRRPDSLTWGRDPGQLGIFRVIKRSLDRRRGAGGQSAGRLPRLAGMPPPAPTGKPRVSVIVPAFDAKRFLAAAIASIRRQTVPPDEIIVVDDGSGDGTAALAAVMPDVTLVTEEHAGVAAARNRGLETATGEIIAWLDADDVWPPDALATQLAALTGAGGKAVVIGRTREFREAGAGDPARLESEAGPATAGELPGATVAPREVYERVGPLSTDFRVGAFMDWLLRAREAGERVLTHDRVVLFRRLHDDNLGLRERDARRDYLKLARARLARKRSSGERGGDG